jgi:hypothetical protein
MDELCKAIAACPLRRRGGGGDTPELLRLTQELLASRLAKAEAAGEPELERLLAHWRSQRVSQAEAPAVLLRLLAREE